MTTSFVQDDEDAVDGAKLRKSRSNMKMRRQDEADRKEGEMQNVELRTKGRELRQSSSFPPKTEAKGVSFYDCMQDMFAYIPFLPPSLRPSLRSSICRINVCQVKPVQSVTMDRMAAEERGRNEDKTTWGIIVKH